MSVLCICRKFLCVAASLAMAVSVNSCFDDSALKNSIDDLKDRVEALENFQKQVQGDIASLQEIIAKLQSSVTVNNVVETENGYTINFSDGTSVTISNGKDGMTPPSITVVEEGGTYYWAYENADGTTEFIRDGDGNKIPVTGEAPQVRINEETGNWEISTDGGKTWEDTEVKAEGSDGDSFFKDVTVDDDYVNITLKDGSVIKVPRTKELSFVFAASDVLYFSAGETLSIGYTMSGESSVTITKPDGWRAAIEGDRFVITAPAAENIYAETSGTVSVILFASNGQSFMADVKVEVVEIPAPEVDLWNNTAVFMFPYSETAQVYYREAGTDEWNRAANEGNGRFVFEPVWNSSKNDASLSVYSLEEGTGIFAGNDYEVEVREDAGVAYTCSFSAAEGDKIPNGDMSAWSMKSGNLPYPNAEGESFWDSGNNSMAAMLGNYLCVEDTENPGVAYLTANMVLGSVFAPGNMYVGDFTMSGLMGTANFGKVYNWTARPKALSVAYKASVGTIDKIGSEDPDGDAYEGKQDTSRIYAVVIDWSKQHGVTSGMGTPTGMWDPATVTSLEEGAIIGYAMFDITASQADFTTEEIPFVWYDTEAKPAEGNYSVVISCATSKRGDYLTGCSTNKLWVDNFEWAY